MADEPAGWLPALREGWRRLATEEATVAGGMALANDAVPFLLANAVWCPRPDALPEIEAWCAARALPPAAVARAEAAVEDALEEAGYVRTHGFTLASEPGAADGDDAEGPDGEEVAWDRALEAARLLAQRHAGPELEGAIAAVLAAGLQPGGGLGCRIGYRGPDPVATVVSGDDRDWWLALLDAGPVATLLRSAFAEARAHGRRAAWLREVPADAEEAQLLRWAGAASR